ncbi:hypothetical protein [Amycolatopsis alkalitolerans]|uniref:Uncharacterized protein n=1 Tax=Amycolatopsis alkalitolerans TaxID=2547244 RepID=A0A5C4LP78_9PSEU|nr:hypothetical protein [Amycolatopsis alkalitolerans]TNC18759.1 hypothetical protein FG385_33450 [Amycolatopsis alkalitolerans]
MDEGRRLRTYLSRCEEHQVDAGEAARALATARFDVQNGRVAGRDPFRLAWRRLRQAHAGPAT